MNWNAFGLGMISIAIPIVMLLMLAAISGGKTLIRRALVHLLCYCIDAGMALTGFVLGFGVEIKSWAWVIGALIVGRFAFYVLNMVYFIDEAAHIRFVIEHADGKKWRTIDSTGMPDWAFNKEEALSFSLRKHADAFACDDPDDVRIKQVWI